MRTFYTLNRVELPIMENIFELETPALVDMLSDYTAKYTQMMSVGCDHADYAKCKLTIEAIQKEIETRKKRFDENSTSTSTVEVNIEINTPTSPT